MLQLSRRQRREAQLRQRKEEKKARQQAVRELRERRAALGLKPLPRVSLGNGKSEWLTVEAEQQARQAAVEEQLRVYRSVLPTLLKRLGKIRDPRNPKTLRHKLTVLMLYGILTFVFHLASRREANRRMSLPMFQQNLRLLFPELDSLPHQDTLNRLLVRLEVEEIEATLIALIQRFIRKKKFYRYLVSNCYPVAIDGSQKLARDWRWSEECLERQVSCRTEEEVTATKTEYYVYVLEANLAFANGMTIPLLSEFLSYSAGDQERNKQDCELKAFYRLARRLKDAFPRLPVLVLLDGLYANGPVTALCRQYRWQFMIVLQDDCLPSVWEEVRGLGQLERNNHLHQNWGNRQQHFHWVNGIEYGWGEGERRKQILNVVICEEQWEEVAVASHAIEKKSSRHAWLSSEPLSRDNVHERCNLGARHRWGIESNFLVEKCQGYQYEHSFSQDWNALRGYHFLMRLGHLLNLLVQNAAHLARMVRSWGLRGLIQFLRETYSGPWLDAARIRRLLASPGQMRWA
jgi:hypothetical protein